MSQRRRGSPTHRLFISERQPIAWERQNANDEHKREQRNRKAKRKKEEEAAAGKKR